MAVNMATILEHPVTLNNIVLAFKNNLVELKEFNPWTRIKNEKKDTTKVYKQISPYEKANK